MSDGRFGTQDNNPDAWVGVSEGFHRRTQEQVTEFLVVDKAAQERHHIGINEAGNEVFHNIKPNQS